MENLNLVQEEERLEVFILTVALGTEVEYKVSYDTELKTGAVEFLVRKNRQVFCNYSYHSGKMQDSNLQVFSEKYGLPLERVSLWLALLEEEKISSSLTAWTY
ncbi:MAG: hypothetical protein UT13_C0001G0818 [Candidatus Pacebacteria bacterium GW2011_GWF2_38_9]|nr:MAG: hypothetical protein US20_C0028G0012 [Candidatus Pacebacteria bacterium GW2011_GWF1_36_5]KKQ89170.1 MAG: hypothetical protein UT13_C0001G0818 [Candidatus Pacebacteria bacterium GW2011_GWF2_38_9]